jgi:hypothetical protein
MLRPDVPFLYDEATRFALGGHHILIEDHELLMVASGYMVHGAEKALAPLTALPTASTAPALLFTGPSGPPSSNQSALRFLIVQRDSVHYRLCSRLAADDPGVGLEVDHIACDLGGACVRGICHTFSFASDLEYDLPL